MDIKKYGIPKEEYNIPTVNEGIQEGRKPVRCKECKYWHDWSNMSWYDEEEGYYCEYSGRAYWTADDFCSRGEKR